MDTESLIAELTDLADELDSQARDSASIGDHSAAAAYREARDKIRIVVRRAKREAGES